MELRHHLTISPYAYLYGGSTLEDAPAFNWPLGNFTEVHLLLGGQF